MISGAPSGRKDYKNILQLALSFIQNSDRIYRKQASSITKKKLIWQCHHECFTGNTGLKKLTLSCQIVRITELK
jgi:hypothetical protein